LIFGAREPILPSSYMSATMPADDANHRTRLSTKGQVVVPKEIRERRNWEPGAELIVEETEDGVMLRRAPRFPATRVEEVYGRLHRAGMTPVTVEEMNAAIIDEARRRHARNRY
jgi:AbrB family looped-hinge helix DNA binding protein